jgi:hypothetical protein
MTGIRRIGPTDLPLARQTRQTSAGAAAPKVEVLAPEPMQRSQAGLHVEASHYRPSANFLAQYIDQHSRWPRAPHRKDRQRQRATSAYLNADMLPDILADALRLHPVDRKF